MSELAIMERMKTCYEMPARHFLMKKCPVIIRVDGRAFHTLTRKMEKPFSVPFKDAMLHVAGALCNEFNAVFGYWQSDEVSLLLVDDKRFTSQPFFDNEINKLVSISASVASVTFNEQISLSAVFDSRAFNIPHSDVCNYFIARQLDAIRNSKNAWSEYILGAKIGMGTARKKLYGLTSNDRIALTENETNLLYNNVPQCFRNGVAIIKDNYGYIDQRETPKFTEDKNYIKNKILSYYQNGEFGMIPLEY